VAKRLERFELAVIMDEHSLALGPKLAWQPAEAAFKAETTAAADESRRATVNFDEERRSTLTVPMGAHPKDVQWNRIRYASRECAARGMARARCGARAWTRARPIHRGIL
jgi:hypothetical protein